MKKKLLLPIFLFVFNSNAQETISDKGIISRYFFDRIELEVESKKIDSNSLKAYDAFSNILLPIFNQNGKYNLPISKPGQIIKVEYSDDNEAKQVFLASKSLSTGAINVYFNHPVETTVAYTGNNATNLGNTVDSKLIQLIDACQSTLDIAIYNSSSPSSSTGIAGAINAAYARGVQIRVIYENSTTSSSPMIPLLNASIPRLASPSGSSYGIMHNKFVIFDANNANSNIPLVWTGSTNWTIPQIEGPDTNNVITIQDQALALGYKLEFEEMWGSNTMTPNVTNSKFGPFKTNNTPHNYIIGGKTIESYFSPSDGVNAKIINTINSANSDINIASMIITRSDIANAIINKYNSGITNTNVLVDSQVPTGTQLPNLQSALAANHAIPYAITSAIMHHKFVVVDNFNQSSDTQVLLGSHNWTSAAETKNDENTLIVHDASTANQYYQAFVYLYNLSSGILGIDEFSRSENIFTVYPNPVDDILYIQNSTYNNLENVTISITDLVGKTILKKQVNFLEKEEIDLSGQSKGIYLLNLSNSKLNKRYKLVVR